MKYTLEQARRVLQDVPDPPDRDFWEALRDGELPTHFCQTLARFRLYSDDIPGPQLVDASHPDFPAMKCRGRVIIGIRHQLESCVTYNVVTDLELKTSINDFMVGPWNAFTGKREERWTTPEEIERINGMLDRVLSYFEKTYGIKPDWEKAQREVDQQRHEVDYLRK
jgi:hypothetical protein